MSVNQSVLACVPNSVNVNNGDSGAKTMLSSWKTLSSSWNQETADEAGKAAVNHTVQWYNIVMPVFNEKLSQLQAEFDEKKDAFENVKSKCSDAEYACSDAKKRINEAIDRKFDYIKMKNNISDPRSVDRGSDGMPRGEWVITNSSGFYAADAEEKQARSELARYEANLKSLESQKNTARKQMDSVDKKISDVKREKEKESEKMESFIKNVFDLNLMNESVPFLQSLKNSGMEFSKSTENKLYSRLFFIENKYRNQFEKFEQAIKSAGKTYKTACFTQTPEKLDYSAVRNVKGKKFKGKFTVSLFSNSNSSAKLSYTGKNDFIISSKNVENAKGKVTSAFKNYELQIDRSNFTAKLNKSYENDSIATEIEQISSTSDSYATELVEILDTMQANGASTSKLRILWGRITNWHLAHWPKIWYKILFVLTMIIVVLGIGIGTLAGIVNARDNADYKKSFKEWIIFNNETGAFSSARKRFALSDTEMQEIYFYTLKEELVKKQIEEKIKKYIELKPESIQPLSDELIADLKEKLNGSLPSGTFSVNIRIKSSSGKVSSRTSEKQSKGSLEGILSISADENGSITKISDLSGAGLHKWNY